MNAAVYLRVSSTDGRQDEANQEPSCLTLCEARGWAPLWFRERQSAVKVRPEWDRLKESCRRGEVRAVVFWALDRIGRNRVQVAHDISELARWGVELVSVQDGWLDQPPGLMRDLLVQLMGWVAEGERAKLIERTKAGQARARALGKHIGRPRVEPRIVDSVLSLLRHGHSPPAISRAIGIPRSTVRGIMAQSGLPRAPGQPTKIRGL